MHRAAWLSLVVTSILVGIVIANEVSTRPTQGLHENVPSTHALINARLVLEPGRVIESGTLVVRDHVILAAGENVQVPADARVWDLNGKSIYPGLIDAYSEIDVEANENNQGIGHWNNNIQAQRSAAVAYKADAGLHQQLRSSGFTARLVAPSGGIIKGVSALVSTTDQGGDRAVLVERVGMHGKLTVPRSGGRDRYPNSPMGAVALLRQTLYDTQWYRDAWRVFQNQAGVPKPETNVALQALLPFVDGEQPFFLEAPDEQYFLRADAIGKEFGLKVVVLGSGEEYRRLDDVMRTHRPIILPLKFPKAPDVATVESARDVTLEELMHWDHAPENPARLREAGVVIALTTRGLDKKAEFLPALRKAVERGFDPNDALAAMTTVPAELFGASDKIGSLAAGKLAHFFVTDRDLFAKQSQIVETWVAGKRFVIKPAASRDLRGRWHVSLGKHEQQWEITGKASSPAIKWSVKPDEDEAPEESKDEESKDEESKDEESKDDAEGRSKPKGKALQKVRLVGTQLTANLDAKFFGQEGVARISAVVLPHRRGGYRIDGVVMLPNGKSIRLAANPIDEKAEVADEKESVEVGETEQGDTQEKDDDQDGKQEVERVRVASYPVNFPLGAFGRETPPDQGACVAFTNATIWTCGPEGTLQQSTLIVRDGQIEGIVPSDAELPADAQVIDCSGKHITPGIIDCHSHMATDGGVNESGQAITAEVRIGDFIDARDIAIYRQLAGGVTTVNILHGSANPIGGQNQVIKLRWGSAPETMKFAEAPAGIKFALGENVKQSNWGDRYTTRYPKSRMGVEQIIRDEFLAARQYHDRRHDWETSRQGLPPRRDLELDAIVEILHGDRWIHCHSYRQDEILALLRVLERFQVQIGTLQHILEGYKVAEVMQRHGAMASAFSDWWAYKIEVYDAIPYNGSLMHDMGIVVSFNSDDRELARHLNHEAAKAVKYGGVSPEEALKFVTLNPAKQLRIDEFVGSLEPNKNADLVVWSGDPLSTLTRCEQTWLDGRKYFDLEEDLKQRPKWQEMKSALVQKVLDSGQAMKKEGESEPRERDLWPRFNIYCRGHAK